MPIDYHGTSSMIRRVLIPVLVSMVPLVTAAERSVMLPRVPADQLSAARAMTSPLPASTETITKGKALYEGKGTCINCHGASGRGDGVAAANFDPSPRNFHHHGFWRHRTEGEVFWVIKHGSSGTGMLPFGGVLTDEEIWAVIQYERSFSGGHGPMSGMGPGGRRGGMGMREGECCDGMSGPKE